MAFDDGYKDPSHDPNPPSYGEAARRRAGLNPFGDNAGKVPQSGYDAYVVKSAVNGVNPVSYDEWLKTPDAQRYLGGQEYGSAQAVDVYRNQANAIRDRPVDPRQAQVEAARDQALRSLMARRMISSDLLSQFANGQYSQVTPEQQYQRELLARQAAQAQAAGASPLEALRAQSAAEESLGNKYMSALAGERLAAQGALGQELGQIRGSQQASYGQDLQGLVNSLRARAEREQQALNQIQMGQADIAGQAGSELALGFAQKGNEGTGFDWSKFGQGLLGGLGAGMAAYGTSGGGGGSTGAINNPGQIPQGTPIFGSMGQGDWWK